MRLLAVLAAVCGVWFAACRNDMMETIPLSACAAVGQQCDLGQGVLGVCFDVRCPQDHAPPCFTCAKQH